jgi:lactoylglutathione lyase
VQRTDINPAFLPAARRELVKTCTRRLRGNVRCSGFSHLVVQVDELAVTIEVLSQMGLRPGPEQHPAGPDGPRTSWLIDPDGYRIELVQWPPGHADGISAADFA